MPGYGVANPGSLIGFVCLVCCISTSIWPMRLSKFTPSLCTVEGGVFGGMYFYHSVYHFLPISNATFGSSFTIRQLALAISSPRTAALRARLRQRVSLPSACGGVSGGGWSGVLVGVGAHLVCFARLLRCSVCLLGLLLCACFRLSLPLLGFFTLLQLAPCFGSCLASRGHRFALGTGGLKQSLLVGGIGPGYSLPKLCFKPFRTVRRLCRPLPLRGKLQSMYKPMAAHDGNKSVPFGGTSPWPKLRN